MTTIYRADLISLDEQVQVNKYNINQLFELVQANNFFKSVHILEGDSWQPSNKGFTYRINSDQFLDEMLFFVVPATQNVDMLENFKYIYEAVSDNGYIDLYSEYKPNDDIIIEIYYNNNIK